VLEVFPDDAVYIRTFDLGGDKFPLFLHMPPEENPFLGWRAIRVCLDTPDLFRAQLRALLRATAHGDVRIMLPLVNEISEIRRTRQLLEEEANRLERRASRSTPATRSAS
jgi:phosphoenolpyruvate-protein phosphotransferase (PTS system enzyme I)